MLKSSCPSARVRERLTVPLSRFDQPVATSEQSFVGGVERSLTETPLVEPPDLVQGPAQAATQAGDDGFQVVDELFDVAPENGHVRDAGVRLRPALPEDPFHPLGQLPEISPHQVS